MITSDKIATVCVHGGDKPHAETGAIITPIFQTSTYLQDSPGNPRVYDYARAGNPTRTAVEDAIASLEKGKYSYTFSSGLAAVQAVTHLLKPDDHVLVCEDVYGGTGRLFTEITGRYGVAFTFIDMRDPKKVAEAITENTRMIWIETPTNPLLQLIDIAALADIARAKHIITVVDNTFASPIFQSPLNLGADIVLHSTTKYIGGHSDLLGGAVITSNDELAEKIKFVQFAVGALNSPFDSFLLLRSIKTLHVRMFRHQKNAMHIAKALEQHPAFSEVIYPGRASHPQHALAKKQMSGYAGIISIRLRKAEKTSKFLQNLKIFKLAESLGGVESLANHPETMTHASVPPARRKKLNISANLVRLSVGIETPEVLCDDLFQAISF